MDNTAYQPKLLSSLSTSEDLYQLEDKLDSLTTLLGTVNTVFEPKIKRILDFKSFNALLEDFQNMHLKVNNQADLSKYIELIKQRILTIKMLKLTIAITPTKEMIDEFIYWANKNLGENILLDITVDKTIVGGCIIEYDGKYQNYTIKKQLDNFFTNNPKLI